MIACITAEQDAAVARPLRPGSEVRICLSALASLIEKLKHRGWEVIGPRLCDGAISYCPIESITDLPAGWTSEQKPGSYRLKRREDGALFGFAAAPNSIKSFLHPAHLQLFSIQKKEGPFHILPNTEPVPRYAFLGVRSCDIAGMLVQNRVLAGDKYADADYEARSRNCLIIAVQCADVAETCFCASMGAGPRAAKFDLALTEFAGSDEHSFLVEVGTEMGAELLDGLPWEDAPVSMHEDSLEKSRQAEGKITRRMNAAHVPQLLRENFDGAEWDRVAGRCVACGNCTQVCPTCFCTTIEDTTDLSAQHAERWQRWDSCFSVDFSYIHGSSIRQSVKSRYRQWLTHKLSYWIDQFGTSGCVGCGRCITWCPVGIDITEEVKAIEAEDTRACS